MTIEEYLTKLCDYCGAENENITITVEEKEGTEEGSGRVEITMDIPEEDASLFIGSRGETLDAIEQMVKVIFHEQYAEQRIILDINGYKKAREERLQEKAITVANQVLDSGRQYVFPYLNSYERYLVHSAISEDESLSDIETFSEDEENTRVLVIQIKEGVEPRGESEKSMEMEFEAPIDEEEPVEAQ